MKKLLFSLSTITTLLIVALPAAGQTGYLKCSGSVGRAGVFVDGEYLGPASRFTVTEKYAVDAGTREVVIRDPRYEEFKTTVTVTAGKTTKVKYKLKPLEAPRPPFGRLRFGGGTPQSFMSVAYGDTSAVHVNGVYHGYIDELNNAGGGLLLPPGTYEVRVNSGVYGQINEKVTVEANKLTVIPLKW